MLYTILAFFLCTIPFYCNFRWGDGLRFPKENLSIIGLVAVIITSFYFYRLKPFKNKWLIFFWMWCVFTTIFTIVPIPLYLEKITVRLPWYFIVYKEMFYITIACLAMICLASIKPQERRIKDFRFFEINFKEKFDLEAIAKVISWVVIILSVYAFIQALGFDEVFRTYDAKTKWEAENPLIGRLEYKGDVSRRTVATLGNPSILAVFISICLPMCLYLRRKVGYIAFLMGLGVIFITQSIMAVIGAIMGIFVYLLFNHKKILLCLLLLTIPITLYFNTPKYIQKFKNFANPVGRVEVHKEAWKIIAEKPLFGYGLGSFEFLVGNNPEIMKKLNNECWDNLHDEFGQLWFTTGLIGLCLFLCFIFSLIIQFLKNITDEGIALFASLSAFIIMSLGYFNFRVAPTSFYGVVLCGLFMNVIRKEEEE